MKFAVMIAGADESDGFPAGAIRTVESLSDDATLPVGMRWSTSDEITALQAQHAEAVRSWAHARKFQALRDAARRGLKTQLREFIERHYSDAQQRTLSFQLQLSVAAGDTAKTARISAVYSWISECIKAYHGVRAQVDQATTQDELNAITLDLGALLATDPHVTLEEVL